MNRCEVISLVDNYCNHSRHSALGLLGEHGISFLIKRGSKSVLFDTGRGFTIQQNAKALGLDLATIDAVVLSHSHGTIPVAWKLY